MSEKQLSFEGAMMIVNDNKWIKLKDIEKLSDFIQEQQAIIEAKDSLLSILAKENEQLRKQVESSETTSNATSDYNAHLESKITTLEKENEQLKKKLESLQKVLHLVECVSDE